MLLLPPNNKAYQCCCCHPTTELINVVVDTQQQGLSMLLLTPNNKAYQCSCCQPTPGLTNVVVDLDGSFPDALLVVWLWDSLPAKQHQSLAFTRTMEEVLKETVTRSMVIVVF
jgi:hypothetical protein